MPCPCKSKKNYTDCCRPYHETEQLAPHALALMRSRYSAYALCLADYIMRTTHPDNAEVRKKTWLWREEILRFSRNTEFIDLEILSFEEGFPFSYVTFTAVLKQKDTDCSYTEKSLFEQVNGAWLYKQAEFL